jgi:lysine 2,3-aminomutase
VIPIEEAERLPDRDGRDKPSHDRRKGMSNRTLRTADDLLAAGLISPEQAAAVTRVAARYAVAVPPALAALIDRADPHDPVARQFVPDKAEMHTAPEELADPIGDDAHSPVEGIVHRYPDRVLLKLTHVCAVYCRFCFRREMVGPGKGTTLSPAARAAALRYIAAHPEVWEVILTGGDPLVLSARRLKETMRALEAIDHVRIVRVHTRMPVAAPERITPALVRALKLKKTPTYVAVHVNHARELTPQVRAALARLADAGLPLLGQSVLLRGVNDTPETLEALMRALVEARVKPYYLHHPDLAPGTAQFRLSIAEGQALVRNLRGRVSGLAQPTYVLDIPGGYGKVPIAPNAASGGDDGTIVLEDRNAKRHAYPPRVTGAARSDP